MSNRQHPDSTRSKARVASQTGQTTAEYAVAAGMLATVFLITVKVHQDGLVRLMQRCLVALSLP